MWETLAPWIIGIIFLILVIFFYLALSGKLNTAGEFFKNIIRFGR